MVLAKQSDQKDVSQMIQDTKKVFSNFRSQGKTFQHTEPMEILLTGLKYSKPKQTDLSIGKDRSSKELKDQRERVPEYMEAYMQLEKEIKTDILKLESVGVDKKVEQAKLRAMKEQHSKLVEEKNRLNNPDLKSVQKLPFFSGVLEGIGNLLGKTRMEKSTTRILEDNSDAIAAEERPVKIRDPMEAVRQVSRFRVKVQEELVREKQAVSERLSKGVELKKGKLAKTKFILMGLFAKMLENPLESL